MTIWMAIGISGSGDHYEIGYWTHAPSNDEMKEAFADDDEYGEVDWELVTLRQIGILY